LTNILVDVKVSFILSLVERPDLRRAFPEYHDAFVGMVGAEHVLAEQLVGIGGLRKVLNVYPLVAPVAERIAEMKKMPLGVDGHARYMQFGEEVLGDILDISRNYNLQEEKRYSFSTGGYTSAPIKLMPSDDAHSWRFARTKLNIMRLHGDTAALDLDQLRDNPRKHEGFTPWVWQFGIDVYADDPNGNAQPLVQRSSPGEWYRDVYMQPLATNGRMLLDMYRLAHTLDAIQDRLPDEVKPLAA
jgi:hypothetical protein